jgi:hypothetical protein
MEIMSEVHEIKIDKLLSLSEILFDKYFTTDDIYGLLTLSYMTVTTYTQKYKITKIKTQSRIEIAINILPQLIAHLQNKNFIDSHVGEMLYAHYNVRFDELPSILHNYICVIHGNHRTSKSSTKSQSCVIA